MPLRREKKLGFKRIVNSKIFLVVGAIALVFLSSALIRKALHDRNVDKDIKKLQEEISRLEETNGEFSGLVDYLSSDKFIEEEARITMGLSETGEKVIIIPPNEEILPSEGAEEKNKLAVSSRVILGLIEEKRNNNPQKWWNYFFNK